MTTFRADTTYSSLYALQEKVFLEICNSKKETQVFSMVKKEKELLDTFMYILNTGLLLNKGNIDVNGKARHSDAQGRPINIQIAA